jgi:hypothetical protein
MRGNCPVRENYCENGTIAGSIFPIGKIDSPFAATTAPRLAESAARTDVAGV